VHIKQDAVSLVLPLPLPGDHRVGSDCVYRSSDHTCPAAKTFPPSAVSQAVRIVLIKKPEYIPLRPRSSPHGRLGHLFENLSERSQKRDVGELMNTDPGCFCGEVAVNSPRMLHHGIGARDPSAIAPQFVAVQEISPVDIPPEAPPPPPYIDSLLVRFLELYP
jgi:hypothetical protein